MASLDPRLRHRLLAASLPLLVASAALPALLRAEGRLRPPADWIRIHVLDVGQGDATLIEGPADETGNRRILMVDAGESSERGNEARHVVEPYLRQHTDDGSPMRPVLDVDWFVPTHYHADHMGSLRTSEATGLFYLWEALNIRIGKILDTGIDYDASGQGDRTYRQWAEERGVQRETLRFDQLGPDRQIDLGPEAWIEVLAVGAQVEGRGRVVKDRWISTTSQNDFSAALVLHYRKFDFFVAGDLSGYLHESWGAWYHSIESALFPHLRPVEVYRVNHHGSQWSSNYPFLQRIRPKVSVISCGKGHHHPSEYAVQRLLGFEDYWSGRPLGSDIFQTRHVDGYLFHEAHPDTGESQGGPPPGAHPHTGKVQRVANGPILIESDGWNSFRVSIPERDPYIYSLHDDPPFLDVPWSVKQARRIGESERRGDEADRAHAFPEVYDREDAESGRMEAPASDEPEGGED